MSVRTYQKDKSSILERFLAGPWLFILPGILLYGAFAIYPVIYQFYVAMTDMTTTSITNINFIGLENFATIAADPVFRQSFLFTIAFVLMCVCI